MIGVSASQGLFAGEFEPLEVPARGAEAGKSGGRNGGAQEFHGQFQGEGCAAGGAPGAGAGAEGVPIDRLAADDAVDVAEGAQA